LMARDDDFEPPEVPFQPKPTSVSILAIPEASSEFASESGSNHTTAPKEERADIHGVDTMILDGRGRGATRPQPPPPPPQRSTRQQTAQPPPVPRNRPTPPTRATPPVRTEFDDDLHSAPT